LVFREVGLFSSDLTNVRAVAVPRVTPPGSVPDQGPSARVGIVELLSSVNAVNDLVFQTTYRSGQAGNRGVYLRRAGVLSRLVDNAEGRIYPGLGADTVIDQQSAGFDAVALGPNGRIAIDTKLSGAGSMRDAVIVFDGQQWRELRSPEGAAATDLLSGINANGQVLFLADGRAHFWNGTTAVNLSTVLATHLQNALLTWENFGGSINSAGRALVRYKRSDGTMGVALFNGQRVILGADAAANTIAVQFKTLFAPLKPPLATADRAGTLKDRPEVDRPSRSGALNDRDQLVLRAGWAGPDNRENTSDDVQAIYLGRGQP
jgi:hypothetical protein